MIFPSPRGLNVNMMPFIMGRNFEDCKLPEYLRPYWSLIEFCSEIEFMKDGGRWFKNSTSEHGKVCYLTIQESMVKSGQSQRRHGLHVDCPGYVKFKQNQNGKNGKKLRTIFHDLKF